MGAPGGPTPYAAAAGRVVWPRAPGAAAASGVEAGGGHGPGEALPPGVARRLDGQAGLSARRDAWHPLRGAAGGQRGTAPLPRLAGAEHSRARARAGRAVRREDLGRPLDRVEASHALLGGPGPEATPWDPREQGGDGASGGWAPMAPVAAPGARIVPDDTAVRRGSWRQETSERVAAAQAPGVSTPPARPGMPTTALGVQGGAPTALVEDASRRQAGEPLQGRRDNRAAGRDKPLARSDALARHEVAHDAAGIRGHGLAHGRRTGRDLDEVVPHACQGGRAGIRQRGDHEAPARTEPRSSAARLASPPAPRPPRLAALHQWRATPMDAPLGAPPRARGTAMVSRQRHGAPLTRCGPRPGAPRDHQRVERAVQRCRRQRNPALFSPSPPRASMASGRTRLSATGLEAGGHAVEDLVAFHAPRGAVGADPGAGRPWASASRRAAPEATRRPSRALWARSGWPCHSTRLRARAARGTRASARWGHHHKRPCERRFSRRQEPWPSDRTRVSAVPARWRKTATAPARGGAPSPCRPTAPRPSLP